MQRLPLLHRWLPSPGACLLAVLVGSSASPARSAAEPAPRSDRDRVAERVLERDPRADLDGDGRLSQAERRAFFRQRRGAREANPRGSDGRVEHRRPTPTEADLPYGDHERQRIDLYLPPAATGPAPLVVHFHGGGFVAGDKANVPRGLIATLHGQGVAVASVNYRFCTTDPLPAAMHDGARAVQTLRAHAERFGLDPTRIAATGGSAGAGIALWVALHDDLADPASGDPVARASTRVSAAFLQQAQVSYDPRDWIRFGLGSALAHRSFPEMYGFDANTPHDDPALVAAAEASTPIRFLSDDDPPLRFDYRASTAIHADTPMGDLIHHPAQGLALQRLGQPLSVSCEVNHAGSERPAETGTEFLLRYLQPG